MRICTSDSPMHLLDSNTRSTIVSMFIVKSVAIQRPRSRPVLSTPTDPSSRFLPSICSFYRPPAAIVDGVHTRERVDSVDRG